VQLQPLTIQKEKTIMLNTQIEKKESLAVGSPLYDENGYLLDQALWGERLAAQIAEEEGVGPLTEKHWRVLHHIRDKFFRLGALPNMRLVCRETAISKEEIYGLFGGCLTIWRIAGLPNPGEEARAYLS
jgi:tRNA 2-thiouridine synthesizing protein E